MLKNVFLTLIVLVIAIGGGAASVWYALDAEDPPGAVTFGSWTTQPEAGTPAADPYARARLVREGVLMLGRTEGLFFVAERDSGGELLRRECTYVVEGNVPPARFWTLYAADASLRVLSSRLPRIPALHSQAVLRQPDNSFVITAGAKPAPGNWLAISGHGPMRLLLTLYDTPLTIGTALSDVELPQVQKVGCNA